MLLLSSCSCLCKIYWSHVLGWEWRCSWSSADRRCSNYIWGINNLIACRAAAYIKYFAVHIFSEFPRILWRLLRSPVWLSISLTYVSEQVIGTGFNRFIVKYLEVSYGVPASKASILTGGYSRNLEKCTFAVSRFSMGCQPPFCKTKCVCYHQLIYKIVEEKKHDDVIKWKHFPRWWPFVRWIPRTKANGAELWCFRWSASK